jgi:hypothetical protein
LLLPLVKNGCFLPPNVPPVCHGTSLNITLQRLYGYGHSRYNNLIKQDNNIPHVPS